MSITTAPGLSGSAYATTVTANASAHTKGAYAQILASTSADASRLWAGLLAGGAANVAFLVDVATGAAASEVVLLADLPIQSGQDGMCTPSRVYAEVDIASGTRIAMRCQCTAAGSQTLFAWIMQQDRALQSLATPVTYGANTGTSLGVPIDAGGTADTKGAYAEITATTSAEHAAWSAVIGLNNNAIPTLANFAIDIATGAVASEVIVFPDLIVRTSPITDLVTPGEFWMPLTIASGTRLSARCASTTNDATDRILTIALVGMDLASGSGGGATAAAYLG